MICAIFNKEIQYANLNMDYYSYNNFSLENIGNISHFMSKIGKCISSSRAKIIFNFSSLIFIVKV